MFDFVVPPSITIADDVFGVGTDWSTMMDSDDDPGGTGFAVFASESLRAADALRAVKPTFSFVGSDGQVYTEEEAEDLFDVYTPNYVHEVRHLPGLGASITADTKGVLHPHMARTMLRLIADALVVRRVPATIGRWERDVWSGAETYTTASDEFQNDLMQRVLAQHREHERGIARGMGSAVLAILDVRGIAVPEAVRGRVLAGTDLAQLDTWVRRAVTSTTAEDVIR